ncbi:MAG: hypothetical protein AABX53_00255 [Nanoarchaeota archaeon]
MTPSLPSFEQVVDNYTRRVFTPRTSRSFSSRFMNYVRGAGSILDVFGPQTQDAHVYLRLIEEHPELGERRRFLIEDGSDVSRTIMQLETCLAQNPNDDNTRCALEFGKKYFDSLRTYYLASQ